MSTVMEEETKRWTAKRKAALVVEIIQAKLILHKRAGPLTLHHLKLRIG